jgi:uncharacterized protein (TIGR03437 family)
VFRAGQSWAILNSDNSLNSNELPAAHESVVAVWATGAGAMAPSPADGAVATPPFEAIESGVRIFVGDDPIECEVVYAGAAPGLVQGVVQINFRLPAGLPRSSDGSARGEPLVVEVGGIRAPSAYVFVR